MSEYFTCKADFDCIQCFPHFNLEPQVPLKKSKCKQESYPANPNTQAVKRPYNFTGVC